MPKTTYVVSTTGVGQPLYLTYYAPGNPPSSTFGPLQDALEFETQEEVDNLAAAIGGGTVGTTRP